MLFVSCLPQLVLLLIVPQNMTSFYILTYLVTLDTRAVGRSENPGVPVLFVGHNLPPLVEIGLTELLESGGAMAPPAPPRTTGLHINICIYFCL